MNENLVFENNFLSVKICSKAIEGCCSSNEVQNS